MSSIVFRQWRLYLTRSSATVQNARVVPISHILLNTRLTGQHFCRWQPSLSCVSVTWHNKEGTCRPLPCCCVRDRRNFPKRWLHIIICSAWSLAIRLYATCAHLLVRLAECYRLIIDVHDVTAGPGDYTTAQCSSPPSAECHMMDRYSVAFTRLSVIACLRFMLNAWLCARYKFSYYYHYYIRRNSKSIFVMQFGVTDSEVNSCREPRIHV